MNTGSMSSNSSSTQDAALQNNPADGCRATKEDLKSDGLKSIDNCPICLKRNVLCEVANHPTAQGKHLSISNN